MVNLAPGGLYTPLVIAGSGVSVTNISYSLENYSNAWHFSKLVLHSHSLDNYRKKPNTYTSRLWTTEGKLTEKMSESENTLSGAVF